MLDYPINFRIPVSVCNSSILDTNLITYFLILQMFSKRQRLDHINMNILPKEVWCIIFSYLDEKSIRSSSATCKLWFELIRSDLKISSHIYLVNDGLNEFQTKLERSEWMWER